MPPSSALLALRLPGEALLLIFACAFLSAEMSFLAQCLLDQVFLCHDSFAVFCPLLQVLSPLAFVEERHIMA